MDYGQPAAQFLQEDLEANGKAFVGKKITVKGMVAKIDVSDPASSWVHLTGGIHPRHFRQCNSYIESGAALPSPRLRLPEEVASPYGSLS